MTASQPNARLALESSPVDTPAPVSCNSRASADDVEVLLTLLEPDLPVPPYAHPGDAGADLVTRVDAVVPAGGRTTVPTGVRIALPAGYAAFVLPRSGLARRHGVTVLNAPGTVDAGYRGEIEVTLHNTDPTEDLVLHRGDRIAQLVVQRVERARFVQAETLPGSHRGDAGFGSSGGWAAGGTPT